MLTWLDKFDGWFSSPERYNILYLILWILGSANLFSNSDLRFSWNVLYWPKLVVRSMLKRSSFRLRLYKHFTSVRSSHIRISLFLSLRFRPLMCLKISIGKSVEVTFSLSLRKLKWAFAKVWSMMKRNILKSSKIVKNRCNLCNFARTQYIIFITPCIILLRLGLSCSKAQSDKWYSGSKSIFHCILHWISVGELIPF